MADDGMSSVAKRVATFKNPKGGTIVFSSLTLGDYVSAREQALQEYKREKIKTYTANADLMPEAERSEWIQDAFRRAETLTIEDLPKKQIDLPVYRGDGKLKRDSKNQPVFEKRSVEYSMWWMSETAAGRLYMTWLSMRKAPGQEHYKLEDADAIFSESMNELENAAQLVGELSSSRLAGNSEAPPETPTEGRRKGRRRKNRS